MALRSWLALLKADVSHVSDVQALIHKGFSRYVTDTADASGVSGMGGMVVSDTADTVGKIQTYQANPLISLACTGDTADTCEKIVSEIEPIESAPTPIQTEPKRLFRQRGPWLTDTEQSAARTYYIHHFNCNTCIAAGRGNRYINRCTVGLALWKTYRGTYPITG